jgi:hypothetical protein
MVASHSWDYPFRNPGLLNAGEPSAYPFSGFLSFQKILEYSRDFIVVVLANG